MSGDSLLIIFLNSTIAFISLVGLISRTREGRRITFTPFSCLTLSSNGPLLPTIKVTSLPLAN